MIKRVTTKAHANIALIKYWGKAGPGNTPATPSIGLCLEALQTETTVEYSRSRDELVLNGRKVTGFSLRPLQEYLELWRQAGLLTGTVRVVSTNSFPTGSGLASSSSGYAALSLALAALHGVREAENGDLRPEMSLAELTRWARRGSGSAARSIPGGLVELPTGKDPAARSLVAPGNLHSGMVLCLVEAPEKEISSRQGMELTRETSPYFDAWVKQSRTDYLRMRQALAPSGGEKPGFTEVGELMESNCLAMHACMLAARPALAYWTPATLNVLDAIRKERKKGARVHFTIDAGPHVALLCSIKQLPSVASWAAHIPGVVQTIPSPPGGMAEIVSAE